MLPITVALPTHNRARLLRRAVASILQQTYSDFELLVLDNGSEDLSWRQAPELADSRVRIICHPLNIGVVNNWNAAIAHAEGHAICIFHDDDVMQPRFLERMVDLLATAPSVGLAFSLARRVDCLGRDLGIYSRPKRAGVISGYDYILSTLRHFRPLSLPPAVVVTRAAYARVGGYSQEVSESAFDLNLYLRVATCFDVGIVDEVLVDYTLHPGQISHGLWRTDERLEGRIDLSLELLAAAAGLLTRRDLPSLPRHEIARVVRRATQEIREYVNKRAVRRLSLLSTDGERERKLE
jgi:glycosyltransferase involved in cell wall biosynthesis